MRYWKITHVATGKTYVTKEKYGDGRALLTAGEFYDAIPDGEFSFEPATDFEVCDAERGEK